MSKMLKVLLPAGILIILIGILVAVVSARCSGNKSPTKALPVALANELQTNLGNMYNFGLITQGNNGIYFVGNSSVPSGTLYFAPNSDVNAVTNLGIQRKRIFAVTTDRVYYADGNLAILGQYLGADFSGSYEIGGDNRHPLYYADLNMKNPVKLLDETCNEMLINKDTVYFVTPNRLGKMTVDGTGEQTIFEGHVSNLNLYDGFLYFYQDIRDSKGICCIALGDPSFSCKSILPLSEDDSGINRFFIVNREIYYQSGMAEINCYNMDTHETTAIINPYQSVPDAGVVFPFTFQIYDNELIYGIFLSGGYRICAYNMDTQEKRIIINAKNPIMYASIANGGIIIPDGDKWKYININDPSITQTLG